MTDRKKLRCLIILFFLTCFVISLVSAGLMVVYAENDEEIKIMSEDQTVHRGQAFEVDLTIADNTGILTLFLTVKYDHSIFKLTKVKQNTEALESLNLSVSGSGYDYIDEKTGGFNLLWDGGFVDTKNGKIVTLTFETDITVPTGTYPIEFVLDQNNTTNAYKELAITKVISPYITIESGAFIAVWEDSDGTPVINEKLAKEHPFNEKVHGYEFVDDILTSEMFPAPLTKATDSKYSYEFTEWKGSVWKGEKIGNSSILYYIADYKLTPVDYTVTYYVDGIGDNTPDGVATEEEFYTAKSVGYDTQIILDDYPVKENYTFYGWYTDERCTKRLLEVLMPDDDVMLYGYFKYNIRETDIPTIEMKYRETVLEQDGKTYAYVDVFVRDNFGISSMMLTIDKYDTEAMKLKEFSRGEIFREMSFFTTDMENLEDDYFKFSWNNSYQNSYEVGKILTLRFEIDPTKFGSYELIMTYDESHDATYVNSEGEIWYTKIMFIKTEIPIGTKNHWNELTPGGKTSIDVVSKEELPYNVRFVIENVYNEMENVIDDEELEALISDNYTILDLYDMYYMANGERIQSEAERTVKIQLTKRQLACYNLRLYYIDDNGHMETQKYNIVDCDLNEDGEIDKCIEFDVNHFSYWAISGDFVSIETTKLSENDKTIRLLLIIFSIVASQFILITIGLNRKKFRHNKR